MGQSQPQNSHVTDQAPVPEGAEVAFFAGGCFWGVEYAFKKIQGVYSSESGYQNGKVENPSYEAVCTGKTGHAESVRVVYNPEQISFPRLCKFLLYLIDPTTLNSQGADYGTQYRSGIYCTSQTQIEQANAVIAEEQQGEFQGHKIVVEVEMAGTFYKAEEYHQRWIENTGQECHVNIARAKKTLQ